MTTDNLVSGADTGLPHHSIPEHQRRNYEASDVALIRMEGLICALGLIANDMSPEARRSGNEWSALLALTDMLGKQAEDIWRLRSMEWVGLGGKAGKLAEADIAIARGEVSKLDTVTGGGGDVEKVTTSVDTP